MRRLHSTRLALGSLVAIAAAILTIGALRWDGEMPRLREVTKRLDEPGSIPADQPQPEFGKIRIGTSTRDATRAMPDSLFEVDMPDGAGALTISVGGQDLAANQRLTFIVSARTRSGWHRVFEETAGPLRPGWIDGVVDLSKLDGGPVDRLRFETKASADTAKETTGAFYWGSVAVDDREWILPLLGRQLPSIILISLDTLRGDYLGALGGAQGVSPHIDGFLRSAFSFRRAYAQYPNTPVSHATLFTGLYPIHHGVYETNPWLRVETLAQVLREHGYFNAAITENAYVSSDFGFDAGFDWYDNGVSVTKNADDSTLGTAEQTFEKAKDWITRFGSDRRFMLFVHTYEVHAPYVPKDSAGRSFADALTPGYQGRFIEGYPGGLTELAHNSGRDPLSEADAQRLSALYSGEINHLDRAFSDLLNAIRTISPPPIVVLFADHGEEFGEHGKLGHGETLNVQSLHVPLAFYWPGHIEPGSSGTSVGLVDVVPTLLDLLGLDHPRDYDGESLAPIMEGEALVERPLFAELQTAWGDCRRLGLEDTCKVNRFAVQSGHLKMVRSEIPPGRVVYDVERDPAELADVSSKLTPEELSRLEALLDDYRSSVRARDTTSVEKDVDEATRERLRALGYRD